MDEDAQAAKYRAQEEESTQKRAALLSLHYLDTRGVAQAAELIQGLLEIDEMYRWHMVPLRHGDEANSYVFGITSATPQSVLKQVRDKLGESASVEFLLISEPGFREFMLRYDPPKEIVYEDVKIASSGDNETLKQVSQTLEDVRSDDILTYLIEQADQLNASDIHIENQRENVRIRFRIDGTLHPIAQISHDKYRVLQASIATRANISTADRNPQTGHLQQVDTRDSGRLINMRIETVPTIYGQDAVIRIFNFDSEMLQIERLGLDDTRRQQIDEIVEHPSGMVMVVGPTGSGKSTTLYSIINALNTPERKILTLEDPVEMSVPGISQIPVATSEGDSFADKLRAVLRLDPDVVMVGEIRDQDTARTAIQASVTGHLVLSTFHASSAAAAFSRIIDMIGNNPIFANAIRMVMSQRLLRRLDDETKTSYEPEEAIKQWIREVLKDLPDYVEKPNLEQITLWQPGTSEEAPFGYKGRIMVMEQLVVTEQIQKYLRSDMSQTSTSDIEKLARENGMMTMLQDAVLHALRGETTIEEVNRIF